MVTLTKGVVTNTEGLRDSWNLICISVLSLLPISAYTWNISTWSANYFVIHHFKWRTSPGKGQNSTAFWGEGALGRVFSCLLCSVRSTTHNPSSSLHLEYSAALFTTTGRNASLTYRKISESTEVSSGYSCYHWAVMLLRSTISPNTNEKHASRHRWTIHAPEAPHEVCLSTKAFTSSGMFSVHSRSMRYAFSFGIHSSDFLLVGFDSNHLLIVQSFALYIIQCAASSWAALHSVQIACIKLFTAEYNASAPCFSITVSSSGSSGSPDISHIMW